LQLISLLSILMGVGSIPTLAFAHLLKPYTAVVVDLKRLYSNRRLIVRHKTPWTESIEKTIDLDAILCQLRIGSSEFGLQLGYSHCLSPILKQPQEGYTLSDKPFPLRCHMISGQPTLS